MDSADVTTLLVSLAIGIPLFVGAILFVVFRAVRRARARERSALDHEGIVRDSGPLWITIRYRDFRAPGAYRGVGISKTRGSLVLTRLRLCVLTGGRARPYRLIARTDLARFAVGLGSDGALHIHSDDPPGATGSIDYRFAVPNAAEWLTLLTEAGVRAGAPHAASM